MDGEEQAAVSTALNKKERKENEDDDEDLTSLIEQISNNNI